MSYLRDNCQLLSLSETVLDNCHEFSCGNADLDDFFLNDSLKYNKELLGKTYCFVSKNDNNEIVAMFTLSNDSVRVDIIPNSRGKRVNKQIPFEKRMRRYPGVLIGRLGVNLKYRHLGIGSQILDFIKSWFVDEQNKTGCRFLVVDAYNEEPLLNFYSHNGFEFLFSSESQESENLGYPSFTSLKTRLMYFDLRVLSKE